MATVPPGRSSSPALRRARRRPAGRRASRSRSGTRLRRRGRPVRGDIAPGRDLRSQVHQLVEQPPDQAWATRARQLVGPDRLQTIRRLVRRQPFSGAADDPERGLRRNACDPGDDACRIRVATGRPVPSAWITLAGTHRHRLSPASSQRGRVGFAARSCAGITPVPCCIVRERAQCPPDWSCYPLRPGKEPVPFGPNRRCHIAPDSGLGERRTRTSLDERTAWDESWLTIRRIGSGPRRPIARSC